MSEEFDLQAIRLRNTVLLKFDEGRSVDQIGTDLGVSRAFVSQIVDGRQGSWLGQLSPRFGLWSGRWTP